MVVLNDGPFAAGRSGVVAFKRRLLRLSEIFLELFFKQRRLNSA